MPNAHAASTPPDVSSGNSRVAVGSYPTLPLEFVGAGSVGALVLRRASAAPPRIPLRGAARTCASASDALAAGRDPAARSSASSSADQPGAASAATARMDVGDVAATAPPCIRSVADTASLAPGGARLWSSAGSSHVASAPETMRASEVIVTRTDAFGSTIEPATKRLRVNASAHVAAPPRRRSPSP